MSHRVLNFYSHDQRSAVYTLIACAGAVETNTDVDNASDADVAKQVDTQAFDVTMTPEIERDVVLNRQASHFTIGTHEPPVGVYQIEQKQRLDISRARVIGTLL